ncbi:MAG: cell division protein CrgA [Acidimicrobiia bacterium]|nr:cell division protein CrgA [Acidimicrobiia bacterium]
MPESKRRKRKYDGPTKSANPATTTHNRAPSPMWYVVLMWALMAVGIVLVLGRFIFELPSVLLLVGFAAIGVGFFMTTRYR